MCKEVTDEQIPDRAIQLNLVRPNLESEFTVGKEVVKRWKEVKILAVADFEHILRNWKRLSFLLN